MFRPPYPPDAYLLRTEKRYRWRDAAGRVDLAALSLTAKLLPTADLMPAHRERLGRVVDRVQKAAVAYAELAKVGFLDERFGFPIIVEVPDGGTRRGVSETGEVWESVFTGASYGFLPDTISRDAEELDVIAGPETSAPNVFIVGFVKPVPKDMDSAGSVLDEYKIFIGFRDYESAQACARANWPPERIGTIQTMPMEVLRGLLNFDLEEGMVQKALAIAVQDGLIVTSPNGVVIGKVTKCFPAAPAAVQKGAISTATFINGGLRLPSQGSPRIMRGKIHDALTAKTNRCAKALDSSTAYQGHTRALSEFPDLSSHPALTSQLTWEYDDPTDVGGWRGAIEPDDESWICFVDVNGRALLWLQREDDGGIVGEPVEFVRPDLVAPHGSVVNALWSTAYENTLPDSAFLYIEPGGEKDAEGKTVPRKLRHFVYRDDTGAIDLPHLRNAIARAPQANLPQDVIARVQEEGRKLLESENAKTKKAAEKIAVRMCPVAKGLDASTPIDRRIVYGVVLEPEPFGGRGDGHDETYGPDVIRRAAYNWLGSFANLNDSHGRFLSKQEIVPVESFIAPVEFTIGGTVVPQGAWVVAAKICSDVLWGRVISGELSAWSIEGHATRQCTTCASRMKAKQRPDGERDWLCPNCDRLALLLP